MKRSLRCIIAIFEFKIASKRHTEVYSFSSLFYIMIVVRVISTIFGFSILFSSHSFVTKLLF